MLVSYGHQILQLDVQNAFLHSDLTEVYMIQPLGFVNHVFPNHVCCFRKVNYGHNQAPGVWFNHLSYKLIILQFQHSHAGQ